MKYEPIVNQKDIKFLTSKDQVINQIHKEFGSPPSWQRNPDFISLSKIILGQQVSLESAVSHFNKLNAYIGDFIPENILKLSDQEMRNCFISRQKAKYLSALATAILEEEIVFQDFYGMEDTEIKEKLISIKGIGNWTAEVFMMFCLQSKDIFPLSDIAVVNTIRALYRVENNDDILKISDNWKPGRSLGSFYMWHYYLKKRGRIAIF